eukprot:scaffold13968_cov119-Isochrysis_galbana.AAC.1
MSLHERSDTHARFLRSPPDHSPLPGPPLRHVFPAEAKGCAELNMERIDDPETKAKDTWMGGFYMEVLVDGWDVEKTVTIDFKTSDLGLGPHACQNVRVVGFTETTITFALIQQPWICCESFGCAVRGERPAQMTFSC